MALAFCKLLSKISEHLYQEDVTKCAFIHSIPKDRTSALGILQYLMQSGAFSHANAEPLVQLLKDVGRHELVSDLVEPYRKEYSEVISPSDTVAQEFPSKEISNTVTVPSEPTHQAAANLVSSAVQETETAVARNTNNSTSSVGSDTHQPIKPDTALVFKEHSSERIQTPSVMSTCSSELKFSSDDLLQSPPHSLQSSQKDMSQPDELSSMSAHHHSHHTISTPLSVPKFSQSFSAAALQHHPLPISMRTTSATTHAQCHGNRSKAKTSRRISAPVIMNPGSQASQHPDTDQFHHLYYTPSYPEGSLRGKRLGHMFGLKKGKKARVRTTQHTWSIERECVLESIWNHKYLDFKKCSKPVPIDIECGPTNPYLSLHLYPYGLFEDQNKSMTLLVKVIIPDDCPPIPSDAPFSLTWEIFKVENDGPLKLEYSRKPMKVQFQTGLIYLYKFLPHSVLQQHCCKKFEISIFINTTYSIHDNYSHMTASNEMLLSLKTLFSNLNIAQEVGDSYKQFGCSLLDDKDGTVTNGIAEDLKHDAVAINKEILGLWLQGKGRQPVQWSTLINTLRDIDMHDLASRVEQNLKLS